MDDGRITASFTISASVMEFVPGAFLCVNCMLLFVSSAVGLMKLQSADNVTVYAVIKTQGLIGFGRRMYCVGNMEIRKSILYSKMLVLIP